MAKGQRERRGLGGQEDRSCQRRREAGGVDRGSGHTGFRTDRVLSRPLRDRASEDRLAFGCRGVGTRTGGRGLGTAPDWCRLEGTREREAGHRLPSPWNLLRDIAEVARRSLGSMLAGRSIDSWAGSWTGKRASVGKLVTREQSPEFRRQRSPRLIHQSRPLCCDRCAVTAGC